MEEGFNKKWALITGAAGEIGKVLSNRLSDSNCNLVLADQPAKVNQLIALKERLENQYCNHIITKTFDLNDIEQIKKSISELDGEALAIDFLINNAGINILQPALDVTENEWDAIFNVNVKGPFFLTQEVGRRMINHGFGSIVFISSQHGVVANENRAAYCTSKAGIINLSKVLALEWAKFNIRVNCVSPTFVESDSNKEILNSAKFKRDTLKQIPLGRYASPDDVARSICFLLSEDARMITGHNLITDGGWTIK